MESGRTTSYKNKSVVFECDYDDNGDALKGVRMDFESAGGEPSSPGKGVSFAVLNGRQYIHYNSFASPDGERPSSMSVFGEDAPFLPSVLEPPSGTKSESMRKAAAELMDLGSKRSRRSIVDVRETMELTPLLSIEDSNTRTDYEATTSTIDEESSQRTDSSQSGPILEKNLQGYSTTTNPILRGLAQVPAILLACLLNLMISIPFGVSYFPIGWKQSSEAAAASDSSADDDIHGDFPFENKEALGIRMFLFSTVIGQLAFTFASKFKNIVALQMVENVPFCHALAFAVIAEQGYGVEAMSTLFFLSGFSSVIVGLTFYALGKFELGRVVYFFPSHVLVGCIGGIGVFIITTAMEVTLNSPFSFSAEGFLMLQDKINLFGVVLGFEVALRSLNYVTHDKDGKAMVPLLAPIIFCLITPTFYLGLYLFGVSVDDAEKAGYFFPASAGSSDAIFDKDLLRIFTMVDFRTISWKAVMHAFPTVIALTAFSLIHVPINIPAFAISTDVDTDMNAELIAHGYANGFSGLFCGLQNYMTYSNSVVYAKSGGEGKASSLIVAALTTVLFVVGPELATYIPRCMAGTLLFHIGIDLFLEGVYDSYGQFDKIEYLGIWVITFVMSAYGMTAALIAGIISALSTYAAQSIVHHSPIRGWMTADTLRSSCWNRSVDSLSILDSKQTGRNRILILQLKGHLFFGNITQLTDFMKDLLRQRKGTDEEPWIVICDFAMVVGIDSSAAHAIAKLKNIMHKAFGVEVSIFVTGSGEGFPCEYALTSALSATEGEKEASVDWNDVASKSDFEECVDNPLPRGSISVKPKSEALRAGLQLRGYPTNRVCESLDMALIFAEDILIARADSDLFLRDQLTADPAQDYEEHMSLEEERQLALTYLRNLCLCPHSDPADIETLFSYFEREHYHEHEVVWRQGSTSNCAKLLVRGQLVSIVDGTDVTESITRGNMLGELGLVKAGTNRLSTVVCVTETTILYTLSKESWEKLIKTNPGVARLIDDITIRYLAHRCQHVSNRIFETRCLPI